MIDGISQNQMSPSSSQQSALQTGNSIGTLSNMEFQLIDDPVSALEDSAEELTFCKDNSKQVKLADRKQKASKQHVEELIEKFSKATALYNNKDDNTRQRLLDAWKNSRGSFNALIKSLEESGSHASSSYVFIKEQLDKETDPHIKTELEKAAHNYELTESDSTVLCIDYAMNGIGSNSCGPVVLDAYRFSEELFQFRFEMVPFVKE